MRGCVFVVLLYFAHVYGATFWDYIKTDSVDGKVVKYCEVCQIRFAPGTVFQDYYLCMNCKCSEDGLSCQTMANAARIIAPANSTCISTLKSCKNHWVMRNNENEDCPAHLIPNPIAMVGK